ncbi:DUF488 domain-containing protein [Spiractinospora alimapuensis]|uniref:DUF488 domain-containing protein n=1 Tax=Spiractinospora alimapuensis TaxID=2820884 RepID=UPI001F235D8C|nr:DUF488 domain-containing protein [Spiractinospora alimapuensis]QVQ53281.1 DUF488 domain-containing protein [Spiractinospora alimapuensis]
MAPSFVTIGHSDRDLDVLARLLDEAGVDLVVDVRKLRGSRRYPRFNEDVLSHALPAAGIGYRPAPDLGGRRPRSTDIPEDTNALWRNQSFHNYADYALSPPFRAALAELRQEAETRRVAVMCSEAVWWRCHRRIIADHLLAHGDDVHHILGPGHTPSASLTPGAVVHPDQSVTYPAAAPNRQ